LGCFGLDKDVDALRREFLLALKGIRDEFDEHLASINDNTNEIQANYEYLLKLEAKLDKVNEKLERLHLLLGGFNEGNSQKIELCDEEKKIFLVLYTTNKPLAYAELASAVRLNEFLVSGYVTNMIEKGVLIVKQYVNKKVFLQLKEDFRALQARENVVNLSQTILK